MGGALFSKSHTLNESEGRHKTWTPYPLPPLRCQPRTEFAGHSSTNELLLRVQVLIFLWDLKFFICTFKDKKTQILGVLSTSETQSLAIKIP